MAVAEWGGDGAGATAETVEGGGRGRQAGEVGVGWWHSLRGGVRGRPPVGERPPLSHSRGAMAEGGGWRRGPWRTTRGGRGRGRGRNRREGQQHIEARWPRGARGRVRPHRRFKVRRYNGFYGRENRPRGRVLAGRQHVEQLRGESNPCGKKAGNQSLRATYGSGSLASWLHTTCDATCCHVHGRTQAT